MKKLTAIAMALGALQSPAKACLMNDQWVGSDKVKHFVVGAAIGGTVTAATKDEVLGFLSGTVVGFGKEVYDAQHPAIHTCSLQDFLVTAAGAYVGSKGVGYFVVPQKNGFTLVLNKRF